MKQLFTIKDNSVFAELQIRTYRYGKYTYTWLDKRTGMVVYESEKIKTTSREAVIFIGLVDFYGNCEDEIDIEHRLYCKNQTVKEWFQAKYIRGIYSFEEKITQKLINCLDWMKENKEYVDKISLPWRISKGKFVPLRDTVKTIDMTED